MPNPAESVKIPLIFVPKSGEDRNADPDLIREDVEFLPPIEQVAAALGDVYKAGGEWVTAEESYTSTALAFGEELEVDGWIIRVRG